MDRKSSGVASMDTFRANSSRSYSVPPGIATGTGEFDFTSKAMLTSLCQFQ